MTKLQRMLTSLVAVIPAAYVIFLLVMAMVSNSLSTMAYLVMGITLLALLVTVSIPVGIMVGGKSKAAAAPTVVTTAGGESGDEVESLEDDEGGLSEASSGSFDAHDVLEESSAEFDIGDSDQDMLGGDSEAELDTEPVDDFDIEEEEEAPKSKKKKR